MSRSEPGGLPPPPAEPAPEDERTAAAHARGLSAPYIAGGQDADPEGSRREERIYGRLLLFMIVAIVGVSAVLTIIAVAMGAFGGGR